MRQSSCRNISRTLGVPNVLRFVKLFLLHVSVLLAEFSRNNSCISIQSVLRWPRLKHPSRPDEHEKFPTLTSTCAKPYRPSRQYGARHVSVKYWLEGRCYEYNHCFWDFTHIHHLCLEICFPHHICGFNTK